MSTLIDTPKSAKHVDGEIVIELESGESLRFSHEENPRLRGQSHNALNNIEISPFGLHWPELDEDLSIRGIMAGDFGQETNS